MKRWGKVGSLSMSRCQGVFFALLLGFVLLTTAGCGAADLGGGDSVSAVAPGGGGGPQAMSAGERAWAMEIFSRVNAERAAFDLPDLVWDESAATAAYAHSWDMDARDYFDHVSPDGLDAGDRMEAAGVEWVAYGENIAMGYQNPSEVVAAWMQSPGHRANILNPSFTHVGVGIHSGPADGPWWTQDFFR